MWLSSISATLLVLCVIPPVLPHQRADTRSHSYPLSCSYNSTHFLPSQDHPLGIIKSKIESYFNSLDGDVQFEVVDNLDPLVNAQVLS